ncbi:MAG TPA: SCO family protein [Polyangiaceae bacterium]
MVIRSTARLLLAALLLATGPVSADPVRGEDVGDRTEPLPKPLEAVDVKEHLGAHVPKTLGFVDERGKPVTLGDYLDGTLPVIFTFNYSDCPMLCSLMLNGFVQGMKELDYTPGREFRVVTVSIDPTEKPERALATQRKYLGTLGKPEAEAGWHFLTGSENNVKAYADALGMEYTYVPARKEYAHAAAVAVASPDGKLVRYLYGVEYPAKSLKLALLEAAEGKIGTAFDRILLYCFHYDSSQGRYAPVAANIMRLAGGAAVVVLGAFVALLARSDARKRRRLAESPS